MWAWKVFFPNYYVLSLCGKTQKKDNFRNLCLTLIHQTIIPFFNNFLTLNTALWLFRLLPNLLFLRLNNAKKIRKLYFMSKNEYFVLKLLFFLQRCWEIYINHFQSSFSQYPYHDYIDFTKLLSVFRFWEPKRWCFYHCYTPYPCLFVHVYQVVFVFIPLINIRVMTSYFFQIVFDNFGCYLWTLKCFFQLCI